MALVFSTILAFIVCLVLKWIWDRRATHSTWQRLGINGPGASSIFFGNLLDIIRGGRELVFEKWITKYGKVFGFYEGNNPVLHIADPDMVKEVLVKQFQKFPLRTVLFDNSETPFVSMSESTGEKWKRVRSLSTPTFSGKKMKLMSPTVHKSIDKLMTRFEKRVNENKAFDIRIDFGALSLDVIASTIFSYDTDIFNQNDSPFLKHMNILLANFDPKIMPLLTKLKLAVFTVFPSLQTLVRCFYPRATCIPDNWFLELAKKMIEDRQSSGEKRMDYLQLMLDLDKDPQNTKTDDEHDTPPAKGQQSTTAKSLSIEEMQAQIVVFLAAGYETTATALAVAAYYLALNPEVQSKLQNEIDDYFPTDDKSVNYETIALPYLDMVFCEVSRLLSSGQIALQRTCTETTTLGNFTIPKDTKIMINMIDIHMNPELWGPEPTDEFVPERFLPERKGARHPMAYLPFGAGPKNCIGMRFALMEAKMTLVNTLKKFIILRCDKTQVPIQYSTDGARNTSVFVKLSKRN